MILRQHQNKFIKAIEEHFNKNFKLKLDKLGNIMIDHQKTSI